MMTLQGSLKFGTVLFLIALFTVGGGLTSAQASESNVAPGIRVSKDLGRVRGSTEINITVHLQLTDKAAFDKAVDALYDPSSPTYHHWMSNADLQKYAPAKEQRQIVLQELEKNGLTILSTDAFGFTIRAHGTIANVEKAFNTEIHQFQYNGKIFRANVRDARLSGEAGSYVDAVAGIESHQVRPLAARALNPRTQQALTQPASRRGAQINVSRLRKPKPCRARRRCRLAPTREPYIRRMEPRARYAITFPANYGMHWA
jgi:hypothetical protein